VDKIIKMGKTRLKNDDNLKIEPSFGIIISSLTHISQYFQEETIFLPMLLCNFKNLLKNERLYVAK